MTDKKEENLREDIFSVIGGISPKDNEYFYGKDADKLVEIVHHYADSQAKERAVGFAEWIGNSDWKYIQADKNKWGNYLSVHAKKGTIYEWKTTEQLYEIFTK